MSTPAERGLMLVTHLKLKHEPWGTQLDAYNAEAKERGWLSVATLLTFQNVCASVDGLSSTSEGYAKVNPSAWAAWEDAELERFVQLADREKAYGEFMQHMRAKFGQEYARTITSFKARIFALSKTMKKKLVGMRVALKSWEPWLPWEDKELIEWCHSQGGANQLDQFIKHMCVTYGHEYPRSITSASARYHAIVSRATFNNSYDAPGPQVVAPMETIDVASENDNDENNSGIDNMPTSCTTEKAAKETLAVGDACESDSSVVQQEDVTSQADHENSSLTEIDHSMIRPSELIPADTLEPDPPEKRPQLYSNRSTDALDATIRCIDNLQSHPSNESVGDDIHNAQVLPVTALNAKSDAHIERNNVESTAYHRSSDVERKLMIETHERLKQFAWRTQLSAYNAEAKRRGWYAEVKFSTFHSICKSVEKSDGPAFDDTKRLKVWEEWEDVEVERFAQRLHRDKAYVEFIQHMRAKYDPEYSRTLTAFKLRIYTLSKMKESARKTELDNPWEPWEDNLLIEWCRSRTTAYGVKGFINYMRKTHNPNYPRSSGDASARYHSIRCRSLAASDVDIPSPKVVEDASDGETGNGSEESSEDDHIDNMSEAFVTERPVKRLRVVSVVSESDSLMAGRNDSASQTNSENSTVNGSDQSRSRPSGVTTLDSARSCNIKPPENSLTMVSIGTHCNFDLQTTRPQMMSVACGTDNLVGYQRESMTQTDTNDLVDEDEHNHQSSKPTDIPDVVTQCLNKVHDLLTASCNEAISDPDAPTQSTNHARALELIRYSLVLAEKTSISSDEDSSSHHHAEFVGSFSSQTKILEVRIKQLESELENERHKFGQELASLREKFGVVETTSAKLRQVLEKTQVLLDERNDSKKKACQCLTTRESYSGGAIDNVDGASDRLLELSSILKAVDTEP